MTRRQFHLAGMSGIPIIGSLLSTATRSTAQELDPPLPDRVVGSYNGDWQTGIPGLANWYASDHEFARVYDDFVVSDRAWLVVGVFSINLMDFDGVQRASWEIRRNMSAGAGGVLIASGFSTARQIQMPRIGNSLARYRIEVSELSISLRPGRYWLSIAPIGRGQSFLHPTTGVHAIGEPRTIDEAALFRASTSNGYFYRPSDTIGAPGPNGLPRHFSQGVLIAQHGRYRSPTAMSPQ